MPGVPVFLCTFHVMQSLAKNLQIKVTNKTELKAMSDALHQMIRINDLGPGNHSIAAMQRRMKPEFDAFCEKHWTQPAFVEYFKQNWANRPGISGIVEANPKLLAQFLKALT